MANPISFTQELYRKAFHLFLLLIPFGYCYLGKITALSIFATLTAILLVVDYSRRNNERTKNIFAKAFGKILRSHELTGDKLCGASFVGIAACTTFLFFDKKIAVTAFAILAISDSMAAIVGRSVQSPAFFEKSSAGAAAFFISGIVVLIGCGLIFDVKFLFYFFGVIAVAATTVIESRPSFLHLDDNLTIPLTFSIVMTLFDLMWYYT